jgi:regulatory protein
MTAREKAIHYLARFARTEWQVRRYLQRKQYPAGEINEAIEFLRENHFLNDSSYAQSYIASRISRGDGPMKIKSLLMQKGISGTEAQGLLKQLYPDELQIENVRKLWRKSSKSRDQKLRFIASRGYPRYVIMRALNETTDEHR